MRKRELQIVCCFGEKNAGEIILHSFLLFLQTQLKIPCFTAHGEQMRDE